MIEAGSGPFTVEQWRYFYAEEIRVVSGIESAALAGAFGRVPRERFLGPPPWQFSSGVSLQAARYRTTSDVRDLYHDVFVSLQSGRLLNNGQPSKIARMLAALDLARGGQVIQVGCGTGYYTAILAETVGPEGKVTALEIDPVLAALASTNLRGYTNVAVLNIDGAAPAPISAGAVLVHAGITQPHPGWLDGLTEGGVLVAPFLVGRTSTANDALVIRIVRRGQCFAAELVTILTIYPAQGLRDPAIQSRMNNAFESYRFLGLRSLRVDAHAQRDTCIVHAPAFCLSAEPAASASHAIE